MDGINACTCGHAQQLLEHIDRITADRDQMAALVESKDKFLQQLACLGHGDTWGNSDGNVLAQQALALTAADALNQHDAAVRQMTEEKPHAADIPVELRS